MNLIEENNTYVCCGKIIPEGFQYCRQCFEDYEQITAVKEILEKHEEKKNRRKRKTEEFFNRVSRLIK